MFLKIKFMQHVPNDLIPSFVIPLRRIFSLALMSAFCDKSDCFIIDTPASVSTKQRIFDLDWGLEIEMKSEKSLLSVKWKMF